MLTDFLDPLSRYIKIGVGVAFIGVTAWGLRVDHLRAEWKELAESITLSIGEASGNRGLKPKDAALQVTLLGKSRDEWKSVAGTQKDRIDLLGSETERLKNLSEELRKQAQAAIAKRDDAARRLADQAISPGDRADCAAQLRDAEATLDLVFEEGL